MLEYRIDWGPGCTGCILGATARTLVILLTGGTKQRQQRDIERAKELWADYKQAAKAAGTWMIRRRAMGR